MVKDNGKSYSHEYYIAHKEHILELNKQYNQTHIEQRRLYLLINKDRLLAYSRQYNIEHREKRNAYARQYRKDHKEQVRLSSLNNYRNHKEERQAHSREYHQLHKEQRNANSREFYLKNKQRLLTSRRNHRTDTKILVLTHYGNNKLACVRCGNNDIRVLSIDHINGGGTRERKNMSSTSSYLYYCWLIKNNFPKGYQTLCMNCQFIKRIENNETTNVIYPDAV